MNELIFLEFGDLLPFFFLAQVETDKERRQQADYRKECFKKVLHQKPSELILAKARHLSNSALPSGPSLRIFSIE
jgi:hypothetical protein